MLLATIAARSTPTRLLSSHYRYEGDLGAAARAARTVGWFRGWVFGEWAVYQGWSGCALTILEHVADESAAGWRLCEEARRGSDLETQRQQYLDVIELARRAGDDDLECEATASLGIMLVFSGLVDEGMDHLDRALAAICGGGVQELPAPTPFSLADPSRVRSILTAAGFEAIEFGPIDEPLVFGRDADDAFGFLQTMGIVEWLTRDLDPANRARALGQLRSTVETHQGQGGVTFGSSAWVVTARPQG